MEEGGTKMRIRRRRVHEETAAAAAAAVAMDGAGGAEHEEMVGGYYARRRKHEQTSMRRRRERDGKWELGVRPLGCIRLGGHEDRGLWCEADVCVCVCVCVRRGERIARPSSGEESMTHAFARILL
jgi:hypothetical protein